MTNTCPLMAALAFVNDPCGVQLPIYLAALPTRW